MLKPHALLLFKQYIPTVCKHQDDMLLMHPIILLSDPPPTPAPQHVSSHSIFIATELGLNIMFLFAVWKFIDKHCPEVLAHQGQGFSPHLFCVINHDHMP